MADITWRPFNTALPTGIYVERYSDHQWNGPYETIPELARALQLSDYPGWGCVWTWDGIEMGGVPSLNPDDLVPIPASGPYRDLERAREAAEMSVDPPLTQWSVVELFGEGFDQPARDGSGELWGTLFVVPSDLADLFADQREAVTHHQIVDTFGYEYQPD